MSPSIEEAVEPGRGPGDGSRRARARVSIDSPETLVAAFTIIVVAVLWLLEPQFATDVNITNVSRQVSVLAILSVGLLFVLIVGGVDVSVAAQLALASVFSATATDSAGVVAGIAVALVFGLGMGLVNGLLVSVVRLSPIVVTIATAQIWFGWALLKTTSGPISPGDPSFRYLGTADVGPVPLIALVAAGALLVGQLALKRTLFGRYVYATGGNELAAVLAGVPVVRTKVACYAIAGLMAGLAGVLLASRVGAADASAGQQTMFAAYAALFIGGVTWGGGGGTALGTAIGVVLLGVIANGLDLLAVPSPYQTIVAGILILLAVSAHLLRSR